MITLYGIPNCDTCRAARKWLQANAIEFRFFDLRADGITAQQVARWCEQVDWTKVLNRRSLTWRKIPEIDRSDLDRQRAIALMLENPTLIRRPVIEAPEITAVGFSAAGYEKIRGKLTPQ